MRLTEVTVLSSTKPHALWCLLTTHPEPAAPSGAGAGSAPRDTWPVGAALPAGTSAGPAPRDTRPVGIASPSGAPASPGPRDTGSPAAPLFSTGDVLAPAPTTPPTASTTPPPAEGPARRLALQLLERAQEDDAPTPRWYLLAEPEEPPCSAAALTELGEALRQALTAHSCHHEVVRSLAADDTLTVVCSSRHRLPPSGSAPQRLPTYYPQLLERIGQLADQGLRAAAITRRLRDEGFAQAPGRDDRISLRTVQRLLHEDLSLPLQTRYRRGPAPGEEPGPDEWWLRDLAIELSMPTITLYTWVRRGWVRDARKETRPPYRWIVRADDNDIAALRERRFRNSAQVQ
ncbi:hypothetical protein GCM10022403_067410 [Streptomyces coacervatus]|uniref:Uncharacterized protein n=1 Tax=Streptomyces coacervatus TaxID=647381 RepID=A0ABP7IR59_9ACTN|nr:hypothetical protein [Streptomyces coacervatus]MDF2266834.1 hypothetical protein [Streptomyces coacervatus]